MSQTQRLALAMLLADDEDEEIQFNQYDFDAEALDCLAPEIMNPSNLELSVVW